jgi:ATP-dependent helicase HepA
MDGAPATWLIEPSRTALSSGMFVRLPVDERPHDHEYRDFRIGQILVIDPVARLATVQMEVHAPGELPTLQMTECRLDELERCQLLNGTEFKHSPTGSQGRILIACTEKWTNGEYRDYYVYLGGQLSRLDESKMVVPFTRQDVDPRSQLRRYEFHPPIWRATRDEVVKAYSQLRNATYGIEDLTGSRVMLLSHQAEVIARVLGDPECRYILADEVGLGKTIEASVILKGLRRQDPKLKALVVVPSSLVQQWWNELDGKFWLRFTTLSPGRTQALDASDQRSPGVIVAVEDLAANGAIWKHVEQRRWDLLIVDEAHHLWKSPDLYNRVCDLSGLARRVLVLSATPIQRRSEEYLALLRLVDPRRYNSLDAADFRHILAAQEPIRRTIAYLTRSLNLRDFDPDEFAEEIDNLVGRLGSDLMLAQLVYEAKSRAGSRDRGLGRAREVIAYVSDNYRIESRILRNRRRHLDVPVPTRELDTSQSYVPTTAEWEALDALYEYVEHCLQADSTPLRAEAARVLLSAVASSPYALVPLLQDRRERLIASVPLSLAPADRLLTVSSPRQEASRVVQLLAALPVVDGELGYLDGALLAAQRWRLLTERELEGFRAANTLTHVDSNHRLTRVLEVLARAAESRIPKKVLVFSTWPTTLDALARQVVRNWGQGAVAKFDVTLDANQLQEEVDRFQASEACWVLLSDELGGEGRNFQVADLIIHVDVPWTPAQLEQRIGRVDRLGREGVVRSAVPFAQDTVEHSLFHVWQQAFGIFTESLSGLEIALEGVQDELLAALQSSVRHGIADLLPEMVERAKQLREAVEEERYFEEGAVNKRLRREFERVGEVFGDGRLLRDAFLGWGNVAGLHATCEPHTDLVRFTPARFSVRSMDKARFFDPPNMEEAVSRSRRRNDLVVKGTFSRTVAVRREDLVFFAPGSDPWIDAILQNALESDRGRCCAIMRSAPRLGLKWEGFDLLYSLEVDPRHLYSRGYDPIHLLSAQGYIAVPTIRIILSDDGQIVRRNDIREAVSHTRQPGDVNLGKRDGTNAQLRLFKERYPVDQWELMVKRVLTAAEETIKDELEFTVELADEASEEFDRKLHGWQARTRWLEEIGADPTTGLNSDDLRQIFDALADGIRQPLCKLESACFWILNGMTGE